MAVAPVAPVAPAPAAPKAKAVPEVYKAPVPKGMEPEKVDFAALKALRVSYYIEMTTLLF